SEHQPYDPPPADRDTFKDLLVFEERLKQNAERLQRQRIKYEGWRSSHLNITKKTMSSMQKLKHQPMDDFHFLSSFLWNDECLAFLVTIIAASVLLAYKTFIAISPYKLIHYLYVALFLVSITTLILFFATGMYTDQIAYAYKFNITQTQLILYPFTLVKQTEQKRFIPQTNRALRPFNMYLITPSTANSLNRTSGHGRIRSMLRRLWIGPIIKQILRRPRSPSMIFSPINHPQNNLPDHQHIKEENFNSKKSILEAKLSSLLQSTLTSSININSIGTNGKSARRNLDKRIEFLFLTL
ncbi:hypothetical protein PSTT_17070, partial [Puccinia striiformis]